MVKYTKKQAIKIITSCAEKYKNELENKTLLFICADKHKSIICYEFSFYNWNFMHLTGVKTDFQNSDSAPEKPIGYLHAIDFYNRCLSHKLSPKDFEFSDDETTHMKLSVLPYVINKNLNANMIGTYNLNKPNLYTDKIAGGIKACMGFVIDENHNSYVPNTLLKEDIRHIVNNYARIILVFRKDIHEDNYKELTYRAKNVTWDKVKIPEEYNYLFELISS